jgi:hypothetical protein
MFGVNWVPSAVFAEINQFSLLLTEVGSCEVGV